MLALVAAATGCASSEGGPADSTVRQGATVLFGALEGTDVAGVRIEVVACGQPDPTIANETLPLFGDADGGSLELLDQYSDESGHGFAEYGLPLEPGCYRARAYPLQADDAASMDCSVTRSQQFTIGAGQTTEIRLLSQCDGDELGYGNVGVVFNQAPSVELDAGVNVVAQCTELERCVTINDPDEDPVEVAWDAPTATLEVDASLTPDGDGWRHCARLTFDDAGDHTVSATVRDLDVNGDPIEQLPEFPTSQSSNDSISFPVDVVADQDACPPTVLLWDDFERPDSDSLEDTLIPGTTWSELETGFGAGPTNVRIDNGALFGEHPGQLRASVDQAQTFDPAALRLRATVQRNGEQGTSVTINGTANVTGGLGFFWNNSAPFGDRRVRLFEGPQPGLGAGIDLSADDTLYYVQVDFSHPSATLTVATGNYPGEAGATTVGTESATFTTNPTGQLLRIGLTDSSNAGDNQVGEIEVAVP